VLGEKSIRGEGTEGLLKGRVGQKLTGGEARKRGESGKRKRVNTTAGSEKNKEAGSQDFGGERRHSRSSGSMSLFDKVAPPCRIV